MSEIEFQPFPKIPRLFREIVVTEKIDGTNAAVGITEDGEVYAQSRKRLITPGDDNFGFARWVEANSDALQNVLGIGLHFGEWWGSGVQRGYGLMDGEKRFSLFNVKRWGDAEVDFSSVIGLGVVPALYSGPNSEEAIGDVLDDLRALGSLAAPGYMNPEGVVVFHTASRELFKVTIEDDEQPKGLAA